MTWVTLVGGGQMSGASLKSINFRKRIFTERQKINVSESALGSWENVVPSFFAFPSWSWENSYNKGKEAEDEF